MPRNGSESSKIAMKVLRLLSCFVGFLLGLKSAKKFVFAVNFYSGHPRLPRLVPVDALKSAFCKSSNANIHLVGGRAGFSQVFNPVVKFYSVDVINLFRPKAVMPKKYQSVLQNCKFVANRNLPIFARHVETPDNMASLFATSRFFACEPPYWQVVKSFTNKFMRKIIACNVCHTVLYRI